MAIITGTVANDTLVGTTAGDIIDGLEGADRMSGGTGNDVYYVDNVGDVIVEMGPYNGIDTVLASVNYTLGANVDHLTLTGTAISGTGNDLNNILTGNSQANILNGGAGADTLVGDLGDDTLIGSGGDTLIGGQGNDTYLVNSFGYTAVIENVNEGLDSVTISVEGLPVTAGLIAGYTLGANIENLTLLSESIGTSKTYTATGNELNNTLTGNTSRNILNGGVGADTMIGGLGNDTYIIDNVGDLVIENVNEGYSDTILTSLDDYTLGATVENLTLTGAAISGTGNGLNNILTGNSQANILNGGMGLDTMKGGLGDDTYIIDNVGDLIVENVNEGNDTVLSTVNNYTLDANVENLTLLGAVISGTGNDLNNILTGNSQANLLNGGAGDDALNGGEGNDTLDGNIGADTLLGGIGDDTYMVDQAGDVVTESAGEGNDTVQVGFDYTLNANVENLTLLGGTYGTGNELNNIITGNGLSNILNGGAGADTMVGGSGNDTYIVENIGDMVIEAANYRNIAKKRDYDFGNDTIQSTVSFNMSTNAANAENLWLMGDAALNGTGNASANLIVSNAADNAIDGSTGVDTVSYQTAAAGVTVNLSLTVAQDTVGAGMDTLLNFENVIGSSADDTLTGNTLDNTLNGGAGADVLTGGLGNDTYVVDNLNDLTIEAAGAGTDTVQSTVSYALSDNIENLALNGASLVGVGNALSNTYTVNGLGTSIVEAAGGGTDIVQSSVAYTLDTNIENLTLIGAAAINGTGNELNNTITGNSAINTLTGGLGNDIYVVQNTGDVVIENAGEGYDVVNSSISYTLGANVEELCMTGGGTGTGNALNNQMIGLYAYSGSYVLPVILAGGLGDDTYWGNVSAVVENVNAGIDTVHASGGHTLAANVENLVLHRNPNSYSPTGGHGNALDNVLDGTQDEVISNLYGKTGNDTYLLREGDIAIESANEGVDTVIGTAFAQGDLRFPTTWKTSRSPWVTTRLATHSIIH